MTHLLLLTEAWPPRADEQPLIDEMHAWAKTGTRVTVMPLLAPDAEIDLPDYWRVDLRLASVTTKQWRATWSQAARHPMLLKEITAAMTARRGAGARKQASNDLRSGLLVQEAVTELHAERPVDLVYSYWFSIQTLGALLADVAPVMTRGHGRDVYESMTANNFAPFKRWMGPRLAMFAGSSHQVCEYAVATFGVSRQNAWFTPMGVERAVPATHASSGHTYRLVSIGPLSAESRPVLTAAAISDFATAHPHGQIEWRHAGDGPLVDDVVSELTSAPANLTVDLFGDLTPQAVSEMLADGPIDMLIDLSASAGLPVSIMQAMARGIPPIVSNVGVITELVTESVGTLVPPETMPGEVAEAMTAFLAQARDPAVRARCRESIANHWDARTNYTRFVERVLALTQP